MKTIEDPKRIAEEAGRPGSFRARGPENELVLASSLSRGFLLHHRICPLRFLPGDALVVAVEETSLLSGLDDLSVAYERSIVTEEIPANDIQTMIDRLAGSGGRALEVGVHGEEGSELRSDLVDLANQPPVVRYVNLLVREGHAIGASDVHLEATRTGLQARFRVDGILQPALEPPQTLERAVVSRVKLLANLDIAERRRPQDGRIRIGLESCDLDLRVSTVPTLFGESVVLRLLERAGRSVSLGDLGLDDHLLSEMKRLARIPHGMILTTGPTGSGKTTTLYAALGLRDTAREKIVTVEDPVEHSLDGIIQVPVSEKAGVRFASMLRSILRQDPDVIMVGETRDAETAEIAVQAALTGHVVFSTLHTGDAVGAVPRLLDLGVAPFILSATLEAVLAQRLVRRNCPECLEPYTPDPKALALLLSAGGSNHPREGCAEGNQFWRGRGCDGCRDTGYRGRTGLFELLVVTPEVREAIGAGASAAVLSALAGEAGMEPLARNGWTKIESRLTTVEEVLRVVDI